MSDRTDIPHDKYGKYPKPRQNNGKLPPRKNTSKNTGKKSDKNNSRDDRSDAAIITLVFPSKPNVRNTDTWQQVCYWLSTIDLVALLMTGSRWMQQAVSETRGVRWIWHYYPILHMFKYISVVDLSLDDNWALLPSAIAALPTSVTKLTMIWKALPFALSADSVVLPPTLTSLNLTTYSRVFTKLFTILPDTLTQLTLSMDSDSFGVKSPTVLQLVQLLPSTLLYLDLPTIHPDCWSLESISALPRSLLGLSIHTTVDTITCLPSQLLTLDLECRSNGDPSYIALLPRSLTSLTHHTQYFNVPNYWETFAAILPPNLTELDTSYRTITDVSAFQRYSLRKLSVTAHLPAISTGLDSCRYLGSGKAGEPLTLTELDCHNKPWIVEDVVVPTTVKVLVLHRDVILSPGAHQFTSLGCELGSISSVLTTTFFRNITALAITWISSTDEVLQLLRVLNRDIVTSLDMRGSFKIRLEQVMLEICRTTKNEQGYEIPKDLLTRTRRFTTLRSLVLNFMDKSDAIKLDSYIYRKRIELPPALEEFTVTGCSLFNQLIFPRSLKSLTLGGIMVPYQSLCQAPRLQMLCWQVRNFDLALLKELVKYLPAKLRNLTILLDEKSTQNFRFEDQKSAQDIIAQLEARRSRYLKKATFK